VEALRGKKVVAVACGSFHMGCVTESGELYTWGSSVWHQLGAYLTAPLPLPSSFHEGGQAAHITIIACYSTAGHGERKNVVEPRRVTALEGKRVVEVSCGAYHTAVRTDAGRVYTFGAGSLGALGIYFSPKPATGGAE
jgi:alpha-tubulin suppressor-like RCC1 family protein